MSESTLANTPLLDDRYGTGRKRSIDRRFGWIAAGLLVLGGLVFLLFSGWQSSTDLEFKTLSYSVIDERTVTVDAQVTVPAGSNAVCAFEALSESYSTVGWKLVELPASENRTRSISPMIITTAPATTGTVRECWVRDS